MSMYENMKFKEYEYEEYPKWIDLSDGTRVLVKDEDEELSAATNDKAPVDQVAERARLLAVAELHDVKIDKRWSLERIAQTITDAGFDASHDPNA